MVDQCSNLNMTDVYIADCYYRDELPARMGQGDYWSLNLYYLPAIPCARPSQLLDRHLVIPETGDLLIFWGQVMPDISDIGELLSDLREVKEIPERLPDGIWLRRDGKLYECAVPLLKMRSLREYFDLNFRLLEKPGIYNLPGYSNSEGCVFGMNVMILPECDLEKPVLIQDHVRLGRRVTLRGQVIIGKDVLVNDGTRIEHSIVLDSTYIGRNMDFKDMIVDGNRVIDVPAEIMVELEDEFLAASSRQTGADHFQTAESIIALILIVTGFPLYLTGLLFRRDPEKHSFFAYFLRVYPKCLDVLRGRAHLVRCGQRDSAYAFRYSDQWLAHQEEEQKTMDDVYFSCNRSVLLILRTVIVSLLKRIVGREEEIPDRHEEFTEEDK